MSAARKQQGGSMKRSKVVVWKAKDGWRWRAVAANGRIVGEGGEGYSSRRKAVAGWQACFRALLRGRVETAAGLGKP